MSQKSIFASLKPNCLVRRFTWMLPALDCDLPEGHISGSSKANCREQVCNKYWLTKWMKKMNEWCCQCVWNNSLDLRVKPWQGHGVFYKKRPEHSRMALKREKTLEVLRENPGGEGSQQDWALRDRSTQGENADNRMWERDSIPPSPCPPWPGNSLTLHSPHLH